MAKKVEEQDEERSTIFEEDGDDFDLSGLPKAGTKKDSDDDSGDDDDFEEDGESGKDGADDKAFGESDGDDSEGEDEKGDSGKSDKSSGDSDDSGKKSADGTGKSGDGTGSDGEEDGDGDGESSAEGYDKGEQGEGDDDFFASEFESSDDGDKKETLNFGELAKAFEVEAESAEDFVAKVNEKIESAKQEFKLDGYSADAQSVIKHLNDNEGKLEDFFNNKEIAEMQSVIASPAESKVLTVRTNELMRTGLSADKAQEQAQEELEEMSTRQVKDMADQIDQQAQAIISDNVKKIVGDREKVIANQRIEAEKQTQKERDHLKSFVMKQKDFAGIELSDKAKENIVREIESGNFDKVANESPAASKFAAYMFNKFGKKIVENFNETAKEQNRKGHNAAIEKQKKALHESEDDAGKGTSKGKQKGEQGSKKNFESWADESIFGEDQE